MEELKKNKEAIKKEHALIKESLGEEAKKIKK